MHIFYMTGKFGIFVQNNYAVRLEEVCAPSTMLGRERNEAAL